MVPGLLLNCCVVLGFLLNCCSFELLAKLLCGSDLLAKLMCGSGLLDIHRTISKTGYICGHTQVSKKISV